jgi:hypothetical protein
MKGEEGKERKDSNQNSALCLGLCEFCLPRKENFEDCFRGFDVRNVVVN